MNTVPHTFVHKYLSTKPKSEMTAEGLFITDDREGCNIFSTDCIYSVNDYIYSENMKSFLKYNEPLSLTFLNTIYDEILKNKTFILFEENILKDFLRLLIEKIISDYERYPVSYNQVMIRGALRYCAKLLEKLYIDDISIMQKIIKFIFLVQNLQCQIETPQTLSELDLTYIENIFENIEYEAHKRGYLPKLDDMLL